MKTACVMCGKPCRPWEQNTDGTFAHTSCLVGEALIRIRATKKETPMPPPKKTLPQALPITAAMKARPVWARRERRLLGETPDAPTEEEKQDAIRVLEANLTIPWSLYEEAERIMAEAV